MRPELSSWAKIPEVRQGWFFFYTPRHVWLWCWLTLVACQTTPQLYLPSSLQQKFFGACGNEGSVSFKLWRDSAYLVSGFIDWNMTEGIHLSNVMGSTIAMLKPDSRADIQLPNMVVRIVVDASGRIVVDDDFTGLYLHELYCLLGGRVPHSWYRDRVVATERDYLITALEQERKILTTVGVQRFRVKLARRILWVFSAGELIVGSYRRQTGYLAAQGFRLNWQQQQ